MTPINARIARLDQLRHDRPELLERAAAQLRDDALGFIETLPLERAAEAYDKMMRNEARFRMVLTTGL